MGVLDAEYTKKNNTSNSSVGNYFVNTWSPTTTTSSSYTPTYTSSYTPNYTSTSGPFVNTWSNDNYGSSVGSTYGATWDTSAASGYDALNSGPFVNTWDDARFGDSYGDQYGSSWVGTKDDRIDYSDPFWSNDWTAGSDRQSGDWNNGGSTGTVGRYDNYANIGNQGKVGTYSDPTDAFASQLSNHNTASSVLTGGSGPNSTGAKSSGGSDDQVQRTFDGGAFYDSWNTKPTGKVDSGFLNTQKFATDVNNPLGVTGSDLYPVMQDKKFVDKSGSTGLAKLVSEEAPAKGAGGNLSYVNKGQKVTPEFKSLLEKSSTEMGRDFTINSGYRSPSHPVEARKGNGGGEHTTGSAADISLVGMNNAERQKLVQTLQDNGAKRFGIYPKLPNILHVDMNAKGRTADDLFMYNFTSKQIGKAPGWFQDAAAGNYSLAGKAGTGSNFADTTKYVTKSVRADGSDGLPTNIPIPGLRPEYTPPVETPQSFGFTNPGFNTGYNEYTPTQKDYLVSRSDYGDYPAYTPSTVESYSPETYGTISPEYVPTYEPRVFGPYQPETGDSYSPSNQYESYNPVKNYEQYGPYRDDLPKYEPVNADRDRDYPRALPGKEKDDDIRTWPSKEPEVREEMLMSAIQDLGITSNDDGTYNVEIPDSQGRVTKQTVSSQTAMGVISGRMDELRFQDATGSTPYSQNELAYNDRTPNYVSTSNATPTYSDAISQSTGETKKETASNSGMNSLMQYALNSREREKSPDSLFQLIPLNNVGTGLLNRGGPARIAQAQGTRRT